MESGNHFNLGRVSRKGVCLLPKAMVSWRQLPFLRGLKQLWLVPSEMLYPDCASLISLSALGRVSSFYLKIPLATSTLFSIPLASLSHSLEWYVLPHVFLDMLSWAYFCTIWGLLRELRVGSTHGWPYTTQPHLHPFPPWTYAPASQTPSCASSSPAIFLTWKTLCIHALATSRP